MYASAMKFCGAMELCGIGFPRGEPVDHQWPEVLEQVRAQKAGVLFAITRSFNPEEADFCRDKGFAALYQFKNPRTGTIGTVWMKDFTGEGEFQTKVPESIPWTGGPPQRASQAQGLASTAGMHAGRLATVAADLYAERDSVAEWAEVADIFLAPPTAMGYAGTVASASPLDD
jgi:hypothetical protein